MPENKEQKKRWLDLSYIPFVITSVVTVFVVNIVYEQTQEILKERLRERLTAIAATAALRFDAESLNKIESRADISLPEFKEITDKLSDIRESNENLEFIYILRPTDRTDLQIFIADADSLAPLEEIDENENGQLDPDEAPPVPGDEYDSSELPALIEALEGSAISDYELNSDQWGTFLSGYAPIFDDSDKVVAVLGIDVEVSDFNILVKETLMPFIGLSTSLLVVLFILTVVVSKIWKNRVEIVKDLDRQKDELLSIVSHQLATPIASVKWYLEMMVDGDLGKVSKEQKEHLTSMQTIASDLSDLVSMILDVSRIQLGRMRIEKQELDLNLFFKEILEIIKPKAAEKKVNLQVKMPASLPKAMLDKRYTHMTVENLLSNAVKYTPEGGDVIFKLELKGNVLYCEVKDTGCGIPKNDQDKIFGKLYRASNVRNTVDGNGFGLYVAKGAVEAQGGKIWFKSEENMGTTFFIELPIRDK